jgi:hypothetical protein
MVNLKSYILGRLAEKSTWAGLAAIALSLGVPAALVGLIGPFGDFVIAALPVIGGFLIAKPAV